MRFAEFAAGLWAAVTGGGVVVLALAYAFVLLQRRRGAASRLQPAADARATGHALHPEDMLSCVTGIWLFLSPWILNEHWADWLIVSNALFGSLIAIFALASLYRLMPIEELVNIVLAAWVFFSPWLLAGATVALAWSNWIAAAVIILASVSSLVRMPRRPSGQLAAHRGGR